MPPQTRALSTSSVIAEKDLNVRVTPNGAGKVTLTLTSSFPKKPFSTDSAVPENTAWAEG